MSVLPRERKDRNKDWSSLWVVALLEAPRRLGALVVPFAAVADVPPPLPAAALEGRLSLSNSSHAHGLHSLLVPPCIYGRFGDGPFCKARLMGSG